MATYNDKPVPLLKLPVRLTFGGSASITIPANSARAISASPDAVTSQLRITIDGTNYDCVAGNGFDATTPNGDPFVNEVTLTSLADNFTVCVSA